MSDYRVLFHKPAADFTESLPIGNGRLGANIYGEILREQLVLNENSMWSGSPEDSDRPDGAAALPRIRELLKQGKNYEAQELFAQCFTCRGKGTDQAHGSEVPFGCYQILGRLLISWHQAVSHGRQDSCDYKNYRRYLDLNRGMAEVSYEVGGKTFTRTYLASADHELIAVRLTCSRPGQIDFTCGLDRDERFAVKISEEAGFPVLMMSGQLDDGRGTDTGVKYACGVTAVSRGGKVFAESSRLHVKEADEALILIAARTDLSGFLGKEACCPEEAVTEDLAAGRPTGFGKLEEDHRKWYGSQFGAFSLSFGNNEESSVQTAEAQPGKVYDCEQEKTTGERIKAYLAGADDPNLPALYLQYARYQLICSSQKDGFPANLQGIWADEIITPWNGDWHLNAQQMIYWIAERANLSDCHVPYLKLTEAMVKPGEHTAKSYYGARGWLAHTCTNPWGFTSPCEDASWGSTAGSPAWQCHHMWEHYLYTTDRDYLKWAYPVMKGAARFYMDILVEDEKGRLVTSPSSSPENNFLDEEGRRCALCEGPAYDRELIEALLKSCVEAQYVLKDDAEFAAECGEVLKRLAPAEIASDGRIMEWDKEYAEAFPFHRHLSHLWGVYPGSLISREKTPELAAAAEKSLEKRGRTTAGWAISFRGCLWARLRDGEKAFEFFKDTLRYATSSNLMNLAYHCDEINQNPELPDMEKTRYPFQIDGNQGSSMLLLLLLMDDDARIDEDGCMQTEIRLLPALPAGLGSGSVRGMRAKGGFSVDMDWKNGKLTGARITGQPGSRVTVCVGGRREQLVLENGIAEI